MKKLQKIAACMFVLAVLMILPVMPAQAKTKVTTAKSYGLKNVKNAKERPGTWVKENGKSCFKPSDGSSVTNRWVSVDDNIYYLDEDGYRVSGWISYNDNLYYTNESGKLRTGWLKLDGKKYYLKEDNGRLARGFYKVGENTYFFSLEKGVMRTGWLKLDGRTYYLGESNGRLTTGFRTIGEDTYFFSTIKGIMWTGWLKLDGKTYYMMENGKMAKGLFRLGNVYYYFSPADGVMQTGWQTVDGIRRYFDPRTGAMAVSKWMQEGDDYHYLNASGAMVKSGWVTEGDKKYYMDDNGVKTTGTVQNNGKVYHFDEDGVYLPNLLGGIIDESKPMVALTFDDGPGKYTGRLLDCLKKYNVKASFFMVGYCVPLYPDSVKRMAEYGCDLGNHSYDHPYFTRLSSASRKSQVSRASENIKKACGKYPTLFRLPYGDGAFSKTVLSDIGLPSIFWSLGTHDFLHLNDSQFTVNEVLNNVKDGDIVLMHDSHYSTVVAAEKIIPALINRGYQLVTVTELAKYKGKTTLQAGKTYTGFH